LEVLGAVGASCLGEAAPGGTERLKAEGLDAIEILRTGGAVGFAGRTADADGVGVPLTRQRNRVAVLKDLAAGGVAVVAVVDAADGLDRGIAFGQPTVASDAQGPRRALLVTLTFVQAGRVDDRGWILTADADDDDGDKGEEPVTDASERHEASPGGKG
jgi:GTPase